MGIETLKSSLGAFAKDNKLNLSSMLSQANYGGLDQKLVWGVALACSYSLEDKSLQEALEQDAKDKDLFTEKDINGIKTAVSLMAMTNVYYRFLHLADDKDISSMPAGLRMNTMLNPGIDRLSFEVYSLAVSVLNGCGKCIKAHILTLEKEGLSKQAIQAVAKITSIINASKISLSLS
tara:strand:- start:283 stop:816 length:534 start_codon:yes stop_codon:yes gene_type:complete